MSGLTADVFRIRNEILEAFDELLKSDSNCLYRQEFQRIIHLLLQTPCYREGREYGEPPDFQEPINVCIDIIIHDYLTRVNKLKHSIKIKELQDSSKRTLEKDIQSIHRIALGFIKILDTNELLKLSSEIEKILIGNL